MLVPVSSWLNGLSGYVLVPTLHHVQTEPAVLSSSDNPTEFNSTIEYLSNEGPNAAANMPKEKATKKHYLV